MTNPHKIIWDQQKKEEKEKVDPKKNLYQQKVENLFFFGKRKKGGEWRWIYSFVAFFSSEKRKQASLCCFLFVSVKEEQKSH